MPEELSIIIKKKKKLRAQRREGGKQPGGKTARALLEVSLFEDSITALCWTDEDEGFVGSYLRLPPTLTRILRARVRAVMKDHKLKSRKRSAEAKHRIEHGTPIAARIHGTFLLRQAELLDKQKKRPRPDLDFADYLDMELSGATDTGIPKPGGGSYRE